MIDGLEKNETSTEFKHEPTSSTQRKERNALLEGVEKIEKTIKFHSAEITKIKKEIKKLKEQTEEYKKSLTAIQFRSIESIGLIASIIALILVYVNIGSNFKSIKDAYIILALSTMSFIIFASLIDYFLNIEKSRNFLFWFAFVVLPLFVFAIIGFLIYKYVQP